MTASRDWDDPRLNDPESIITTELWEVWEVWECCVVCSMYSTYIHICISPRTPAWTNQDLPFPLCIVRLRHAVCMLLLMGPSNHIGQRDDDEVTELLPSKFKQTIVQGAHGVGEGRPFRDGLRQVGEYRGAAFVSSIEHP